jgi:hypothetical protein
MAIFVATLEEDIQNLSNILEGFGEVARLCTNFHKCFVFSIRCGDNLDDVLDGLSVMRTSFTLA